MAVPSIDASVYATFHLYEEVGLAAATCLTFATMVNVKRIDSEDRPRRNMLNDFENQRVKGISSTAESREIPNNNPSIKPYSTPTIR